MDSLTPLQRRLLALLEEAGEDDLSALTNSVGGRVGAYLEVKDTISALEVLLRGKLIQIAMDRDGGTLRWIPLGTDESLILLKMCPQKFQWSAVENLWKWPKSEGRVQVLLTQKGSEYARIVLAEDGWPE